MGRLTGSLCILTAILLLAGCGASGSAVPARITIHSYEDMGPADERPEYLAGIELDIEIENLTDETILFNLPHLADEYKAKCIVIYRRIDDEEGFAGISLGNVSEPRMPSFIEPRATARGYISFWMPDDWEKLELSFTCYGWQEKDVEVLLHTEIKRNDL